MSPGPTLRFSRGFALVAAVLLMTMCDARATTLAPAHVLTFADDDRWYNGGDPFIGTRGISFLQWYHSVLVFDLDNITHISHLTLELTLDQVERYRQVIHQPTFVVGVGSVGMAPARLIDPAAGWGTIPGAFDALRSRDYGVVETSWDDPSYPLAVGSLTYRFELPASAIATATAALGTDGLFAVGVSGFGNYERGLVSGRMVVESPEPGSLVLVALGGLFVGVRAWSRRKPGRADSHGAGRS